MTHHHQEPGISTGPAYTRKGNTMDNTRKYALRLGFGSEGHGQAIAVGSGPTCYAAKVCATALLQRQFGGLWESKLRDTYIGSPAWLLANFPGTGVSEALSSYD